MCPTPAAAAGKTRLVASPPADRRSHERYPINLELTYRLLQRGRQEKRGSGRTLNVASGGVLLQTNDALPAGSSVELVLNWPFLLEGVCPLKLVMRGRVVRCDGKGVAIQAKHHEFRTAGARVAKRNPPNARVRSLAV